MNLWVKDKYLYGYIIHIKGERMASKNKKTKGVLSIMKNCKYKLNELNGITIVSLVVTITVLLILARHKYFNNIRK